MGAPISLLGFLCAYMQAFKQVAKKPTMEPSLAERSEAHRAKRGAARSAAGAEGARRRRRPRAARGLQTKARMRPHWQRLLSWRINSLGRRESVLCTYGIHIENDLIDELELDISWVKWVPGKQTGETPPGAFNSGEIT